MFTLEQIAKYCGGKLVAKNPNIPISGVSIDSRQVKPGELFAALKGERADGHDFLIQVFQKGARAALVTREIPSELSLIIVSDVTKSLQDLAKWWRSQFNIPVIAVTGSVGKTTTKECIGAVLSRRFKVRVGHGNWNNHLGVPLNLMKLSGDDGGLVMEMGANHCGEIKFLCEIAQPTAGIITGIHPSHLEGFGSVEGIYNAKLELADFLDQVHGIVIANGDDHHLIQRLRGRSSRLIVYGSDPEFDYSISSVRTDDGFISFSVNRRHPFRLQGYGSFNAMNALGAIAAAGYYGVDLDQLAREWDRLPTIEGRFQVKQYESMDIAVVDDAYNANPYSFSNAVRSFALLANRNRKIAVIGDMLELGSQAEEYHRVLGAELAETGIDYVIGVGALSKLAVESFRLSGRQGHGFHFENCGSAASHLLEMMQAGDRIFVKGSHGMRLDQVCKMIEDKLTDRQVLI